MLARERRLKLEGAAGISSGDEVGSEVRNEFGFAIAKRFGGVGLNEIVDSCGAAADGGFGNLSEFEAGNAREQSAGLRVHALRVQQVAGIVKGYVQFQRMARSARIKFRKGFADVLALCGKAPGAFGVFPIVTEQVNVFLHVGAASGCVGHNCLDVGLLKHLDGFLGEFDGGNFFAGVDEQRATASLRLWSNDFTALGGENANRGGIHLREKLALHAAKEKAHAAAFTADRRSDFRDSFLRGEPGKQRFHRLPFFWKQLGQA